MQIFIIIMLPFYSGKTLCVLFQITLEVLFYRYVGVDACWLSVRKLVGDGQLSSHTCHPQRQLRDHSAHPVLHQRHARQHRHPHGHWVVLVSIAHSQVSMQTRQTATHTHARMGNHLTAFCFCFRDRIRTGANVVSHIVCGAITNKLCMTSLVATDLLQATPLCHVEKMVIVEEPDSEKDESHQTSHQWRNIFNTVSKETINFFPWILITLPVWNLWREVQYQKK